MRWSLLLAFGFSLALVGCEVEPYALESHYATIEAHNVEATIRVSVAATLTRLAHNATRAPTPPVPTLTTPTLGAPTPSASPTHSSTSSPTGTPTLTPTITLTATPTNTATPGIPKLSLTLLGCTTGFDILQGLGEVTNAYATLRNIGGADLTDVCATLSASDEGKPHRDKTRCAGYLPPGFEITQKLTVDTEYSKLTSITLVVTATQGIRETKAQSSCPEIAKPLLDEISRRIGVVRPSE